MTHNPTHGEPGDWQPSDDDTPGAHPPTDGLLLPHTVFSLANPHVGKSDLEQRATQLAMTALDTHDAADVYLALKQAEHVVKTALEAVKPHAFDGYGRHLSGGTSGDYIGNRVAISYPIEVTYTEAVAAMMAQHKKELDALKAKERAEGLTTEASGKGRITITLKP